MRFQRQLQSQSNTIDNKYRGLHISQIQLDQSLAPGFSGRDTRGRGQQKVDLKVMEKGQE